MAKFMEKQIRIPDFVKFKVGFEPQFGQNWAYKSQHDFFG